MKELLMTLATAYRLLALVFAVAALACACELPRRDSLKALPPTWLPPQGSVDRVFEMKDYRFVGYSGVEKNFHRVQSEEVLYWLDDGSPQLIVAYFRDANVEKLLVACREKLGIVQLWQRKIDGRVVEWRARSDNPAPNVRSVEIEKLDDRSRYPRPSELGIGGDDEFHVLEIQLRPH